MTTLPLTKRIDPVFCTESKRRKLIGFDGYLEGERVVYCAANYAAAEDALNEIAYERVVYGADVEAEIDEYVATAN